MNSTPYSTPYPPPSPGAFPLSQPGVPQPEMPQLGMPHPGMLQPEMSPAGVPSYGISVPQSGAPQVTIRGINLICKVYEIPYCGICSTVKCDLPGASLAVQIFPKELLRRVQEYFETNLNHQEQKDYKLTSNTFDQITGEKAERPKELSQGKYTIYAGPSSDKSEPVNFLKSGYTLCHGWSSPNTICPLGLEYLIALDHLRIQQQYEILEAVVGWETENKYHITNANGQPLYYIAEESDTCARLCLGALRCCEFRVVDTNQREVLHMVRPFRCSGCCCSCCMQVLEVYSGGVLLGTVTENCSSFFRPSFSIRNASGKTVLRVKGPWFRCCGTVRFKIRSADDVHRVGEIKKKWGGFTREILTDADNFSLRFPIDLDVKIKAVLLGACILIDFLYFERNGRRSV
ncbi:hypothetical protein E2986_00018 [Frieseomelitta varia]|uniref:Phospholipid scramblase n=1 Tax=Frieseomelitta varia TaxID=561572 RepID=A0A833S2B8_9HYME|nr:hypothetical protein E2986_00018 [Frieseomelitta varia]